MNKCSILGHKRIHLGKPFKGTGPSNPKVGGLYVIDHCDRCKKIIGAWIWYKLNWNYFKR